MVENEGGLGKVMKERYVGSGTPHNNSNLISARTVYIAHLPVLRAEGQGFGFLPASVKPHRCSDP